MSNAQRGVLLLLGAIWGASFLFMRVAAPEFGPLALIELRVAIAAAFLGGVLAARGELMALRKDALHLSVVGALNSAIPFSLFAFATLSLPAGYSSMLNATVPLFGALVGYVWLRERLAPARALGLALGFAGVVVLVWHKLTLAGDRTAVLAGLLAALLYAIAAHHAKRHLAHLSPLAIAGGSLIAAAALLLPFALLALPSAVPSWKAIGCACVLGIVCTAFAYLLFFRLFAEIGATRSMVVTYLVPLFGTLWGALFLGEPVHATAIAGGALVLLGVAVVARRGAPPARTEQGTRGADAEADKASRGADAA
ncbi:MAG: DMT family transporter [Planctomycetota bacterium]|nr:MAG: DMT family transporter [Planctomycetota bacterium]